MIEAKVFMNTPSGLKEAGMFKFPVDPLVGDRLGNPLERMSPEKPLLIVEQRYFYNEVLNLIVRSI